MLGLGLPEFKLFLAVQQLAIEPIDRLGADEVVVVQVQVAATALLAPGIREWT